MNEPQPDNRVNKVEFFSAISKNCKTILVRGSKKEIKKEIERRGITKNNIVIFRCQSIGGETIIKKPIHRPRFKLTNEHRVAMTKAALNFLSENGLS